MDNNVVNTESSINKTQKQQQQQKQPQLTTINTFWRNSDRIVPGRPSPKNKVVSTNSHTTLQTSGGGATNTSVMMSTFRDYQNSVSDAWDTGDDEFCIISNATQQRAQQQFTRKTSGESAVKNFNVSEESTISKQVSQSAALSVIEIHRTGHNCGHQFNSNNNIAQDDNNVQIKTNHNNSKQENVETNFRPRFLQVHALPGRPQLQKITSNTQDSEYETKIEKFKSLFESPLLDLVALKKLSWSGVPRKMRAISWRLLSKYLPPAGERRNAVLESKRQGYQDLRQNYFKVDSQDESQQDTYRQIHIDVPRMNPQIALFQQKLVQEMFERILFIWSIRHPASGYVQGINDLVTPFFIVFLQEVLEPGTDIEKFDMSTLTEGTRDAIEADSFWCLSKFLDCIQDNYIFAQLGIQEKVNQLKDLIQRIDGNLHRHLLVHGVDYLQFSFRWMNNLLTRELPLHCTIRLWDTYLAESDGFALFHLYVCAAFLLHWKDQLMQQNDFQGLLLLLQNLPTHNWSDRQINVLVAEAFRLKFTYADAPKHLETKS
uniref:Rab-GAP TBC domain-containing protein n=1 Tax=Glossina brevipalpis TaxID=37001 RepID=A0A1A9W9E3_9MUSC